MRASALAIAAVILALLAGCGGGQAPYKIAFASDRDGNSEIYTADADGGNVQRLTFSSFSEDPHDWSPDGRKISYGLRREINSAEVAEEWRRQNPWITPTAQNVWEIWDEASSNYKAFIYIANTDGSNPEPIRDVGWFDYWPVFSPSGQEVVFFSDRGGDADIYTIGVDGSNLQQLTVSGYDDLRPDWSPDGTRIAYMSEQDGNWQIYLVDMQTNRGERRITRGIRRLTSGVANNRNPVFSPSGAEIAYHSVTGDVDSDSSISELFVLDLETLETRQVTRFGKNACCADWSPDGAFIYFMMKDLGGEDAEWDIYRISSDGESSEAIISNPDFDGSVVVSPFLD